MIRLNKTSGKKHDFRPGDKVRVKSPEALLETLNDRGCLDAMPLMPEMLDACGHVFTVYSRADKTCDTATRTGGRELFNSIHLQGQRCDGSGHGGCQAECLNFWKESWLESAQENRSDYDAEPTSYPRERINSAKNVLAQYTITNSNSDKAPIYSCQATRLPEFTRPLNPWALRQYWRDVVKNKVPISRVIRVAFLSLYTKVVGTGIGYRFWVSAYNSVQKLRNRQPWPLVSGQLKSTPSELLDLQVGEFVRVRSFDEILKTLNKDNKNRGMSFDAEMVRFCGSTYQVHSRVNKIVNEETGEMMNFGNPCIILEDVWCSSEWSICRRFCPRSIYHWWREIWLERVTAPDQSRIP